MFLRSSSGWLYYTVYRVFYVGTENQEERLKSHPIYDLEDLKDLWSKMTIFLETFTADGYLGRNLMVCPSETKNGSWRLFLDGETSHLWLEVIDICLVHCTGSLSLLVHHFSNDKTMRTCVEISKNNKVLCTCNISTQNLWAATQNELVLAKYLFSEGVEMNRRKGNAMKMYKHCKCSF